MHSVWKVVVCGCVLLFAEPTVAADVESPDETHRLVVGTKLSPPFAFKNSEDQWTGISIELWKHLCDELNLEYEFRELTLDELLNQLESGEIDAAVAAISVTAERHERVDFCHPHFSTGLGIAVSAQRHASLWTLLQRMLSPRLLAIVGGILAIVIVCGWLFWLLERKGNEALFGGRRRKGVGMGVWWSTILLLGHKGIIPASATGRILAVTVMLSSIMLLSLLTGVIASVLTLQQLDTGITHPSDLSSVRVVTVGGSTSADYLRRRRISFRSRPTADAALQAVAQGQADAVVYDEALLKFLVNNDFAESILVLPVSFNEQEYAIALQAGSELRKPLNKELLRFRATDDWDDIVFRYLGN